MQGQVRRWSPPSATATHHRRPPPGPRRNAPGVGPERPPPSALVVDSSGRDDWQCGPLGQPAENKGNLTESGKQTKVLLDAPKNSKVQVAQPTRASVSRFRFPTRNWTWLPRNNPLKLAPRAPRARPPARAKRKPCATAQGGVVSGQHPPPTSSKQPPARSNPPGGGRAIVGSSCVTVNAAACFNLYAVPRWLC